MKQFDLTTYNQLVAEGKTPKIVTRSGNDVRIVCTDMKSKWPIVALATCGTGKNEVVLPCYENGRFNETLHGDDDLFFADLEPIYRPYANAKEFLEAQKVHGPHITAYGQYHLPTLIDDYCIVTVSTNGEAVSEYDKVIKLYRWQDGATAGILEE